MISKKINWILFFTFLSISAYSQDIRYQIAGQVTDTTGNAIEYATVAIVQNGINQKSALTDQEGKFKLGLLASGTYELHVKALSFKERTLKIKLPSDTLLSIQLKIDPVLLEAVTIKSEKPLIEMSSSKIIFHVSQSPLINGGTLHEAINQTPGAFVEQNGTIRLNGKVVRVLINNRDIKMSGQELATYLRSLPASTIENIEAISNPPAEYDAGGGAIININTKKNLALGFWGSLINSYTQNTYGKYSPSLHLNYNKKRLFLNFLGNFNTGKYLKKEESYVNFGEQGTKSPLFWQTNRESLTPRTSYLFKLNGDYKLSSLSSIGGLIEFSPNKNITNTDASTIFDRAEMTLDSTQQTNSTINKGIAQYSANLTFKTKFNTNSDKSMRISHEHLGYNSLKELNLKSSMFIAPDQLLSTVENESNSGQQTIINATKLDFEGFQILNANLIYGIKHTNINTENNLDFTYASSDRPKYNLVNTFNYDENVSAAYVSLSKKYIKHQLNFGLRAEHTLIKGQSEDQGSFENKYMKLFPSLSWSYKIDKKNKHQDQLQVSYSRRIRRPEFWRLNPFKFYITPNYYLTGNPFLLPADIHSLEAMYNFNNKLFIWSNVNFTKNQFTNFAKQDNQNLIYSDIQLNLNKSLSYALNAYYRFTFANINSTVYIKAERKREEAYLNGQVIDQKIFTGYFRMNNNFTISKEAGLSGETSFWYATPNIQGIYKLDKRYEFDVALKKTFKKNRGFVSLNLNDLFYSNVYKLDVDSFDQQNGFSEWNDSRGIRLTLAYNFGKAKKTRDQNSMIREEKGRL